MDATSFDRLVRSFAEAGTRRGLLRRLAVLPLGGPLAVLLTEERAAAKRRRRRTLRRRREHVQSDRKKKKRKKKNKKTSPPPPSCVPSSCPPNACGSVPDGCGGTLSCGGCAGNTLCSSGTCQPCDVCQPGCFFNSVQLAINAAAPGETIRICPGLYPGDLTIGQSLTLIGAGDGLGPGNTILQGSGTAPVVSITDNTPPVTMQGLRITGGSAAPNDGGGGIFNITAALTLIDCTISGNKATSNGGGGGIYSAFATLRLTGCTVSGNMTGTFGGGIYLHDSRLTLTDSTVAGNTAGIGGGGIYLFNSATLTLDAASRVTGNHANLTDPDSGGGIRNEGFTVTLSSADNVTGNTPDNCSGTVPLCQDPP